MPDTKKKPIGKTKKAVTTKAPDCCDETQVHPDHRSSLPKLNRVEGQVRGIQKMVNEQRYCVEILVQIRAAMAALRNIEMEVFEKHTHSCLIHALNSPNKKEAEEKITELMELLRRRSII